MKKILTWIGSKKDVIIGAILGGLATLFGLGLLSRKQYVQEDDVQEDYDSDEETE